MTTTEKIRKKKLRKRFWSKIFEKVKPQKTQEEIDRVVVYLDAKGNVIKTSKNEN